MNNSIPKLIFQTWKSKTDIPVNFDYWMKTFKEQNPEYAFRLWDDVNNRTFIADQFPWFLETYDGYPAEIYRADAVRYFFLYRYGGIYADLDTECLKPLDELLTLGDVVLGRMGTNPNFEHSIPNAIMLSKPRQEFWLLVISLLLTQAQSKGAPEYTTGPVILKTAYDMYTTKYRDDDVQNRIANIRSKMNASQADMGSRSNVGLVPGYVFYPLDWSDVIHDVYVRRPMHENSQVLGRAEARAMFPHSFMTTYWAHSW